MSIITRPLDQYANRVWDVTTKSVIEPVTLEEVKLYGKIDGTARDDVLRSFIQSVREAAEDYLSRALLEQTVTMYTDWWPGEVVELPLPPLISITSVATLDEDDVATTYASTKYYTNTTAEPGKLIIRDGYAFPNNTSNRRDSGYRIIYKAGYGTARTDVPSKIRDALKMWCVAALESMIVDSEPPPEAARLLDPNVIHFT